MDDYVNDPYRTCQDHCNHDLARGVGVADLLESDGPFPPNHLIVNFSLQRAVIFEEGEEGVTVQDALIAQEAV